MNAQNIIKILDSINFSGFSREMGMLPENVSLLDDIFNLAKEIEPWDKNQFDEVWRFWLWADKGSYEEFSDTFKSHFTYLTVGENNEREEWKIDYKKMKEEWSVYFPEDIVWFQLTLRENEENRILSLENRVIIYTGERISQKMDMSHLLEWILEMERKCVEMIKQGTYSVYIANNLPYKHRSGVTKMSTYWKYVPKDKQRIFGKIDSDEWKEFQAWNQDEESGWLKMTSNDYFDICNQLYELLELKKRYPLKKEGSTPKECYMVYAANYSSVKPFLELDGDSADAFDNFVESGMTEHHTWEVCLVPNIHLYPEKVNGKYYIRVLFDHKVDEYDLLVHLTLALRRKGFPIIKPTQIEERMLGEQLAAIAPYGDKYDLQYERYLGVKTEERRTLPRENCEGLIKEIQWFPTGEW